jgi:hypothetical protein
MVFNTFFRRARRTLLLAALVLAGLAALAPQPSAAQSDQRCFPQTGFCISGAIRSYWEQNGGLEVFGYPITSLRAETIEGTWTGPTQWFERDRIEDHSAEGQGILAGRLGALRFSQIYGSDWQQLPADPSATPGCQFFRETQFNLCEPFLSYWQRNGGLPRFGYPITRQRQETVEGSEYTVQYFERRRMELHPENAGTPFEILLGLLGRDVLAAGGTPTPPSPAADMAGPEQQMILDAAWQKVQPIYAGRKLSIGLVDSTGEYAYALAQPQGRDMLHVFLKWQAHSWQVIHTAEVPVAATLNKLGVPQAFQVYSERFAVVMGAGGQLQDSRGPGVDAYITRPRISGSYARFTVAPAAAEGRESVSMFFKNEGGAWRFMTAGTAFPEEDMRALGVPQELWLYGESVSGPA